MDNYRSTGAKALHGLRQLRRRGADYYSSARSRWGSKLAPWLASKMRARFSQDETLWTPTARPDSDDEPVQEVDSSPKVWEGIITALLESGFETTIRETEVPTDYARGFINEEGMMGVILLFEDEAAIAACVAPFLPPSMDVMTFMAMTNRKIAANLGPFLSEVCGGKEYEVFGHQVIIPKFD